MSSEQLKRVWEYGRKQAEEAARNYRGRFRWLVYDAFGRRVGAFDSEWEAQEKARSSRYQRHIVDRDAL